MLKRALVVGLVVASALPGRVAAAPKAKKVPPAKTAEVPLAIQEPVRLTVGASSELMGVLAPDESALYFVSDAGGTSDVMVQRPVQRAPVALSRGLGDAMAPQLSPDGSQIAYVSFEADSTGDVCTRAVSGKDAETRCIAAPESSELSVLWWDASTLAVLSRDGLHGDFQLKRVPLGGGPATPLLARNMVGPALSPDRRWLAYIPVDRASEQVGVTFAQRTGQGIALERLDARGEPTVYRPRLPGVTGSVGFTTNGDALVFSQFLNDTNKDGVIDGDDNAVIFSVPFRAGKAPPIAAGDEPDQLTSARWDCHYPAPSPRVLIASCSHEGSLDAYSLPLEGSVPRTWNDARLVDEIASARDPWTRLLLASRRHALAKTAAEREAIIAQVMVWHVELGEYESAIYDAENRLESAEGRTWGALIAALARHRRADQALVRGETSEQYIESERARAATLRAAPADEPVALAQLRSVVISEIEDDIGDKHKALAMFRALEIGKLADARIAPLVARRAERLYHLHADRKALLDVYLTLAGLEKLEIADRLAYARRFVDELGRGRTRAARKDALASYRSRVSDTSELALLLDVEAVLLTLDDAHQEPVREQIFALYKQNKDPARRRALVLDTLRTAAKLGNEYLQYQFVTSWASSLKKAEAERKYAEHLYDDIVLDRAYGEGRQGEIGESRGYFYAASAATDSLEAHIGFVEARMAEGGPDPKAELDKVYQPRADKAPNDPIVRFVRAYRLARELPNEPDLDRHEEAISEIVTALEQVASVLPKQPQVHQLWGFALHQRARRAGSRQAAVDANRQYLLALDLARNDERLSASLLHRLGLLQASLGNHGLALRYLKQRDELPHVRPLEELGLCVALARSAWHSGEPTFSRDQLRRAEKLIASHPELARFSPLVADRLGLALSATGEAREAAAQYQKLAAMLQSDGTAAPLNRLKAELGVASNALASDDAKTALSALDAGDRILAAGGALTPEPKVVYRRSLTDDYRYAPVQYRAMAAGLRADASDRLGDTRAALAAMKERVALLEARLKESEADEDRLELSQAYLHVAALQFDLGQLTEAATAIERGLALSDAYNESTGSETNDAELALIQAYAELCLRGHVNEQALARDLRKDLKRAYDVLCKYRNPRLFKQRFLFKTYLAELSLKPRR